MAISDGNFGVGGSPKVLNDLLTAAGVPLSEVGESAKKKRN
jgi:hypothetical protein